LAESLRHPRRSGYTATRHQREDGAGYLDDFTHAITAGHSSITALAGSTEEEQFEDEPHLKQAAS
jgi:isocitrate lyase